jgi:hypothetical protein
MIEFNFIIGTIEDAYDQIATWLGNRPRDNVMHFDDYKNRGLYRKRGYEISYQACEE